MSDDMERDPDAVQYSRKVMAEILILAAVLALIGFFMQDKVEKLLSASVEQSVARQTADFSVLAEERFQRELAELRYAAHYMERNEGQISESFRLFEDMGRKGVSCGIFSKDYGALQGKSLSLRDFRQLVRAFSGSSIVDYASGKGLLFAVPVLNGDNVRYVLYRLYSEDVLYDYFGLEEYDADSRILIRERNGTVIVPYKGFSEEDKAFFQDRTVQMDFERIREKLRSSRSAAVYSEGPRGRFFLFGADLPQTNCSMIGFVPWDAVAGGVSRIYTLVFTVVSLLLMLFALASIYLFMIQSKVAETESIRNAKEIADRANRAKSDFLASMSHEIRTPINAVLGMNEMILRESKEPFTLDYAKNIAGAGTALLSLINDILDFSKIESGRMELVKTAYQLDSLLMDTMNLVEPKARDKGLSFHMDVEETLPNELYGDAVRIRQIFINLLTNAVKYTPKGSVVFAISGQRCGEDEVLLEVRVSDTGIGIKEEDKGRLFRDFERLDAARNQNIEGTGLGLAITVSLLRLMDGEIHVESVYGEGSTFYVKFTQKIVNGESAIGNFSRCMEKGRRDEAVYHASFRAPKARVLAVDDNEVNLLVVKNLLKETEMDVSICLSGTDCLRKIQEEHFDIILLDHMMPGMDGIETLKKAKALESSKCPNTPIIALTANAISGAREMFLSAGFSDYLTKPINPVKLDEMMLKFLPKELAESPGLPEQAPKEEAQKSDAAAASGYIDRKLGLLYSGGMEDMYQTVLAMFADSKADKQKKMQAALEGEDWKGYTILVHALKSTSLTVGCQKLSDEAKALEQAGKLLQSSEAEEAQKEEKRAYIKEHHDEVMTLYDAVAEEAGAAGKEKEE